METKHQVFVSSTYRDLVEERQSVIHALLELDCIPAGMELFPATDEDAWTLIKEVINDCDYYVLVLAGKYGSTNSDGISYTEMEFDYAVSTGKPVISFLHENIELLPATSVERTEILQHKLAEFRTKAQAKHCKFWNGAEDLGGKVSRSMVQLKKRHPSLGWVPGRYAATKEMIAELNELRIRDSQNAIQDLIETSGPPEGSEELAQGEDKVVVESNLITDSDGKRKKTKLFTSWDTIFSYCGPSMIGECSDEVMMGRVQLAFWHAVPKDLRKFNKSESVVLPYVTEDKIRIQLQALGLIAPGFKKRAVADTTTYWRLTPHGEKYLLNIRAVRKPVSNEPA